MKKETAFRLLALVSYSALLLVLVINHEYWFDEAQAWNIARDNDIPGIFAMMKYEGHPPLWHLILKIFTSLGCSWNALGLVSWGIMTGTAAIILFCLSVKPYFQAALLLSSGMLYTNSVISRVYCVIYLLTAIIALLYPKRKKHPVLFGIAVALLANTHICMCGLVGIIGIFMLIDFFKDFKKASNKQNILGALGLVIAGARVIMLVLPLIGSMDANYLAASRNFTVGGVIKSFAMAFSQITGSGISPNLSAVGIVLSAAAQILLIAAAVLMRRKRRSFVMLLVFAAFYMAISGVIWYTTPNRGSLFIYSLIMIWVMSAEEEPAHKAKRKTVPSSDLLKSLLSFFDRIDDSTEKSFSLIFATVLALSIPSGVKYAAEDLFGEFDPSKAAAEFIRENIPENALLVSYNDDYAALMTYLPERRIYSVGQEHFYSFSSHKEPAEEPDKAAFMKAAERYGEVWLVSYADVNDPDMIFSDKNSVYFYLAGLDIAIFRIPVVQPPK